VRRTAATGLGLLIGAIVLLLGPSAAADPMSPSQADPAALTRAAVTSDTGTADTEVIRARVRTDDGTDVPGVSISVAQGGKEIGSTETDDKGIAEITVPEPGTYEVTLDPKTLSGPAADLVPRQNPITTTVNDSQTRTVAFRMGSAAEAEAVTGGGGIQLDRLPQLTVSGLRFGLIIALAAIGLSLIYGTTGLTNFAHGELVTFGALTAYFINVVLGVPLVLAGVLTVIVCGFGGYLNDRLLWRPLRRRGTGLIAMMIVSIGLAIVLRYGFLYVFGGSTRSYADYQGQSGVGFGSVALRPLDWISMALAIVVLVAVGVALLRTRLGKATRAVADNPALAAASGIDVDGVIRSVWISGAALAGLSGLLLGLAQQVNFQMGLQLLLLIFAAVILGGLGTAFGAMAGALVVGVFIEVCTLIMPTELKNVGALAVLIVVLLVRPQGILGRAERVG
jgi:branched-chain amino acid transport system permease protein